MSSSDGHLHFVQSTEPLEGGGLGRAALALNDAFNTAGRPSLLVSTDAREAPPALDNARLYTRQGPTPLFYAPGLRQEARGLVEARRVVHAHGFYVYPNKVLGGWARRLKRALVCHPHGMFEPWILKRSRWKKRLVHWLFEDANFRHACLWRALTSKEAEQVRALGLTGEIVVAPNGIDLAPFEDAAIAPASKERRRLLFLGRLHPKKGIDLLLRAASQSPAFQAGWEIVVAGPDEGGHLAELQAVVRELRLEARVTFPGTVTGADKVSLLRSADVFALTSHSEGFSVAILESMACGVPVLGSHACNFPELARDGGGWLCEAEVASVRTSLEGALACTDEERQQRGRTGQELVRQRYTWQAVAQTLLEACDAHCH
ncbi:MAG: glycosyltransferase [Opitutales bacterium]